MGLGEKFGTCSKPQRPHLLKWRGQISPAPQKKVSKHCENWPAQKECGHVWNKPRIHSNQYIWVNYNSQTYTNFGQFWDLGARIHVHKHLQYLWWNHLFVAIICPHESHKNSCLGGCLNVFCCFWQCKLKVAKLSAKGEIFSATEDIINIENNWRIAERTSSAWAEIVQLWRRNWSLIIDAREYMGGMLTLIEFAQRWMLRKWRGDSEYTGSRGPYHQPQFWIINDDLKKMIGLSSPPPPSRSFCWQCSPRPAFRVAAKGDMPTELRALQADWTHWTFAQTQGTTTQPTQLPTQKSYLQMSTTILIHSMHATHSRLLHSTKHWVNAAGQKSSKIKIEIEFLHSTTELLAKEVLSYVNQAHSENILPYSLCRIPTDSAGAVLGYERSND